MADTPQPALDDIQQQALEALNGINSSDALAQWKTAYLGRSSAVMGVFSGLGKLPAELRPITGQKANVVKVALEEAFTAKTEEIRQGELLKSLESQNLDITLPGRPARRGRIHPPCRTCGIYTRYSLNSAFRFTGHRMWRRMSTTLSC